MRLLYIIIVFCGILTANLNADDKLYADPQKVTFKDIEQGTPEQFIDCRIINKTSKIFKLDRIDFEKKPFAPFSVEDKKHMVIPRDNERIIKFGCSYFLSGQYSNICYLIFKEKEESKEDTVKVLLEANITNEAKPKYYLRIPDFTVKIGEKFDVPIILDSFKISDRENVFSFGIEFNSSVLTPTNVNDRGNIENGIHRLTFFKYFDRNKIKNGDTIEKINFTGLLGNSPATDLKFSYFDLNDYFFRLGIKTFLDNGNVRISDIYYYDSIPRLVQAKENDLKIKLSQNPVKSDFDVTLSYIGNVRLKIYDLNGSLISDLSNNIPKKTEYGDYNYTIYLSDLMIGKNKTYLITLSSPNSVTSKLFFTE